MLDLRAGQEGRCCKVESMSSSWDEIKYITIGATPATASINHVKALRNEKTMQDLLRKPEKIHAFTLTSGGRGEEEEEVSPGEYWRWISLKLFSLVPATSLPVLQNLADVISSAQHAPPSVTEGKWSLILARTTSCQQRYHATSCQHCRMTRSVNHESPLRNVWLTLCWHDGIGVKNVHFES